MKLKSNLICLVLNSTSRQVCQEGTDQLQLNFYAGLRNQQAMDLIYHSTNALRRHSEMGYTNGQYNASKFVAQSPGSHYC